MTKTEKEVEKIKLWISCFQPQIDDRKLSKSKQDILLSKKIIKYKEFLIGILQEYSN